MNFTEDSPAFFGDFGADAVVGGVAVLGIFADPYADPMGFPGSSPSLLLSSLAAPSAVIGDPVTVGAASYTIAGVEPDGTGLTRLRLTEA